MPNMFRFFRCCDVKIIYPDESEKKAGEIFENSMVVPQIA
jgi:hypothetical protein